MTENEIAKIIVDSAYKIHNELGPGLFESVYEVILAYKLKKYKLNVECQKVISIAYEGVHFDEGFRVDIVVDDKVFVELKSVEEISNIHKKQLLTYLRLTNKRLGLLINFGSALIKNGIVRIVNNLEE